MTTFLKLTVVGIDKDGEWSPLAGPTPQYLNFRIADRFCDVEEGELGANAVVIFEPAIEIYVAENSAAIADLLNRSKGSEALPDD